MMKTHCDESNQHQLGWIVADWFGPQKHCRIGINFGFTGVWLEKFKASVTVRTEPEREQMNWKTGNHPLTSRIYFESVSVHCKCDPQERFSKDLLMLTSVMKIHQLSSSCQRFIRCPSFPKIFTFIFKESKDNWIIHYIVFNLPMSRYSSFMVHVAGCPLHIPDFAMIDPCAQQLCSSIRGSPLFPFLQFPKC